MSEIAPKIPAKYTVFPLLLTAMVMAALFAPLPVAVRGALALTFFLGMGSVLGDALLSEESFVWRAFFGVLGFLALTILVGSGLYYVFRLDLPMTAVLLLSTTTITSVYAMRTYARHRTSAPKEKSPPITLTRVMKTLGGVIATSIATALVIYGASILASAATDGSLRSPWDVVPRMFFVLFFLAVLATVVVAHGNLSERLSLIPTALLVVLTVSVATIVYKIGFGFDPFIHRATEQIIFSQGMISPKPLYYIGHYVLVTVLARLLGGFVAQIDTMIVPITLALIVPCAYYALRKTFQVSRASAAAASTLLLALPLSAFIAPTPQGFADALFLLTVFCAVPAIKGMFPRELIVLLSLATVAIHPLAGIPLLAFAALLVLFSWNTTRPSSAIARVTALGIVTILGAVALPLMFLLNSWISHADIAIDTTALESSSAAMNALGSTPVIARHFIATYDFVYAWKTIRAIVIALAGAAGLLLLLRKTKRGVAFLFGAFVLFINFFLMRSVIQFPFLIAYERANYADRLLELLLFFMAPLALIAAAAVFERLEHDRAPLRIGATVLVAMLATSSLYLNYPRRDKYESSRGWSTSGYDVRAVQLIASDAGSTPYAVLANQSTSAAAVHEFGFKKYFASTKNKKDAPIFFYPIPTGGPLYKNFLDMNAAFGSRAVATNAMDLTGANTVYYVVTYYWWDAKRIILTAKKESDRWWSVDDKDFIFKYVKK